MRICVTGSSGRLGRAIRAAGRADIVPLYRDDLDLSAHEAIRRRLEHLSPDVLINCAAMTDMDGCEIADVRCAAVNTTAPAIMAQWAARSGRKLVHISTDSVFGMLERDVFGEADQTEPCTVYGRSKRASELGVLACEPRALIVRIAWLYGPGDSFPERPSSVCRIGSPAFAPDVAVAIFELIEARASGIVHVANAGLASRPPYPLRSMRSPLGTSLYTQITGKALRHWQDTRTDWEGTTLCQASA